MNESKPRGDAGRNDDEATQRLMALAGCIDAVVVEFDGDTRYLNVWTDDASILRIDPVTSIGKTLAEVLGEVTGAPLATIVRRVFETGQREQTEWSVTVRNQKRWIQGDFKRVANGDTFTVVGLARDISERKESEERLRQLEERYRLAGQATNDLLYDWDMVADHTTWGRNVNAFLGLDELAMTGKSWVSRMAPEDVPRVMGEIRRVLKSDESTRTHRYRVMRGDGTWAELLDRCFIVRHEGRAIRMVGSLTDVTQLNRLQAQLVQADRLAAIGALAAGVGHEINNPLSYVLGNVEYALDVGPFAESPAAKAREDEARVALEEAREGAKRIAEIVRSLKLFSQTDRVEVGPVQVESVLEQSIKMAENQIRHRARLVRDFSPVPLVAVNESQLGQVCLNLLINASQAIHDGKQEQNEIRVSTRVDAKKRVVIAVSDTGAGIKQEHLERIFEPFFTTKPLGEGTGIGLAVCRSIVQSMGGEISVTSIPGQRTTFEIALPVAVVAPSIVPRESVKPKMLVIDDDLAVGRYIARALRSDCDVTTVGSSSSALAELDAGTAFDVVLCDMMMPEMNGVELYEVLRERHAAVLPRMFFMTGGAFTPETARFLESMPDRALEKPIAKDRLRALLLTP